MPCLPKCCGGHARSALLREQQEPKSTASVVMIDDPFGKPCLHLTSTDGEITQALQWDGGRFTLATTIAHDLIRPSTLEVTHFRGPDNIVYEGPHAPCHRSILFNPTEFFVVQTRPHTSQAHAE